MIQYKPTLMPFVQAGTAEVQHDNDPIGPYASTLPAGSARELSPIPSHSNATSNRQLKPHRALPTKRRLEVDNPGHTERG